VIPITGDEYLKAMIYFAGDENQPVREKAIDKLSSYTTLEIKKHIEKDIPENSVLELLKLSTARRDASLFIALLSTKKIKYDWIFTCLTILDEEFWKTLITHRDFIAFSIPRSKDFTSFFAQVSVVLSDLYLEESSYLSEGEKEKILQEATADSYREKEEAILEEEDFDFPDFLLADTAFEGLKAQDTVRKRKTAVDVLNKMSMGQKVKAAVMGNLEVRKILIKSPNKQIALAVLNNQKITEKEVSKIASDPTAPLEVIAHIAKMRSFTRSYQVKLNLVLNPKTPLRVGFIFLDTLRLKDLKMISKSHRVSTAIKVRALKKIKKLI